jgi:hypothetical protein
MNFEGAETERGHDQVILEHLGTARKPGLRVPVSHSAQFNFGGKTEGISRARVTNIITSAEPTRAQSADIT